MPTPKNVETAPQGDAQVDTVTKNIADIDVSLPVRWKAGDPLTDILARVVNEAVMRQFANNKNAAFKAWQEKVKAAGDDQEKIKVAGSNPCTAEKLLADYVDYLPSVGTDRETAMEKARNLAGERAVKEVFAEHNDAVKANGKGPLGALPVVWPVAIKGKVTAEQAKDKRVALIERMLASPKQAERVQKHLDIILAEQAVEKPVVVDTPVLELESVEF